MNQKNKSNPHALYICYFGLSEPLVQTQVLPYLRELQKDNIKISLMTFEQEMSKTWTRERIEEQKRKSAAEGIDWYCLPYHKSPSVPATLYDVLNGARLTRRIIREKSVDILHARVHVPALMAAIARKSSGCRPKMIFDIRGFFPEEYTDAGHWKENGLLYRAVKVAEKWLLKEADAFVVLTERAREILFPESREIGFEKSGRPVEVIPCCVDFKRFEAANESSRDELRQKLKFNGRRVITYVGSFDGWYLTDEILNFLEAARTEDISTFALILTQRDTEKVVARLKEKGFSEKDFWVASVAPSEIPMYLGASDIALSFIKQCYSKQASSPTKIAEYLASGLPIISNRGIGDLNELIETDEVGILVEDFTQANYAKCLYKMTALKQQEGLIDRCKISAKKRFDLIKVGGARYRSLYNKLLSRN